MALRKTHVHQSEITTCAEANMFQDYLFKLSQWAKIWQLPISESKTNIMTLGRNLVPFTYKISAQPLNVADQVKDLGVIIEADLKFKAHIAQITLKASQRSYLIYRSFLSRDMSNLIRVFKVYVRPLLENLSPIWSPHYINLIQSVEKIQKSFTKRLPGLRKLSYGHRLENCKLQSLEHRRLVADLILTYNIVRGNVSTHFDNYFSYNLNKYSRGHSLRLQVLQSNSDIRKYFFANRIVKVWNSLPDHLVLSPSISKFKRSINVINLDKFLSFPTYYPRVIVDGVGQS